MFKYINTFVVFIIDCYSNRNKIKLLTKYFLVL